MHPFTKSSVAKSEACSNEAFKLVNAFDQNYAGTVLLDSQVLIQNLYLPLIRLLKTRNEAVLVAEADGSVRFKSIELSSKIELAK